MPREKTQRPSKKNQAFALIKWMESTLTDIVSLETIKLCDRKENCVTKLLWVDKENNKKEFHKAKILKINGE